MSDRSTVNGVGELFRFITPILVTIAIFFLGWIKTDISSLKTHFTNHLFHHQDLEVGYEKRLTQTEKIGEANRKDINRIDDCVEKMRQKTR